MRKVDVMRRAMSRLCNVQPDTQSVPEREVELKQSNICSDGMTMKALTSGLSWVGSFLTSWRQTDVARSDKEAHGPSHKGAAETFTSIWKRTNLLQKTFE